MKVAHHPPPQGPHVAAFLRDHNAEVVARMGELIVASDHPALVAESEGLVRGVLTYVLSREGCEVLTLHAAESWHGVGTALLQELDKLLTEEDCRRVWLITTNDNLEALRFYQRRGFRLIAIHPGAVDVARRQLKPEIPERGNFDIPIRDELLLEKHL